jgi:hypothetical protein
MSTEPKKIGWVIEAVKLAVKQYGISPHSPVVIRVGDFGPEMEIENVKVQGGLEPKLVLQARTR